MNFSSFYVTDVTSVMMAWQMLILLIGLCVIRSGLAQSDLQIIIDSIEITGNEEYIKDCHFDSCDNDEMVPVIKVKCEIIKEIPADALLSITLFGMVNGEPTEPTGIEIFINTCQMMNDTMFIGSIITELDMPRECPIKPINLEADCFTVSMENLPDFFPSGEYKLALSLDNNGVNVFIIDAFISFY